MINKFRKLKLACLLICLSMNQHALAALMNNDFSHGFNDWQGEVVIYNYDENSDSIDVGDITGSYADNFSLVGNSVTLTTSFDDENDYWSVVLFQDFIVDTIAANSTLTLSLDVFVELTSIFDDYVFAELLDLDDNLAAIDLTAGGDFDITAWSGVNASIQFGVMDGDYDVFDSLTVSNLAITETLVEVPEPATAIIFLMGIAALMRKRCSANSPSLKKIGA